MLPSNVCEHCGESFCRSYKSRFCSRKCGGAARRGSKNPNWKGGIAKRNAANAAVRKKVRDVGKCERCGSMENLQGHHIKHFATHPHLGAELSNIRVLCGTCHGDEHPERRGALARSRTRAGNNVACVICGKLKYVVPSRIGEAKFCSRTCYGRGRGLDFTPNKPRTGEQVACFVCGKFRYIKRYRIVDTNFCSRKCYHDERRRRLAGELGPGELGPAVFPL